MKKSISVEATLTPDCKCIVGSLSEFERELIANGYGGARIKVTYTILKKKTTYIKEFVQIWSDECSPELKIVRSSKLRRP